MGVLCLVRPCDVLCKLLGNVCVLSRLSSTGLDGGHRVFKLLAFMLHIRYGWLRPDCYGYLLQPALYMYMYVHLHINV